MATEKRLIDANALLSKFKEHRNLYAPSWEAFKVSSINVKSRVDEIDTCMADVINAPTIDAVEVVYGRWIITETIPTLEKTVECSACRRKTHYPKARWNDIRLTKYCPNCGAKMDLEEQG